MSDYVYFYSPVGWLRLAANGEFLIKIDFTDEPGPTATDSQILQQAVEQLSAYFDGKRKVFSLPLDMTGTPFQKQVWAALSKIQFGQVISYGDLARAIDNPKAVRAVGQANGRNPVPIIVPCHRVISADGTLGGYSSGLWRKKWLLEHEGVRLS